MLKATYFLLGILFSSLVYILSSSVRDSQTELPVKGIDREYYLEVTGDSIFLESRQGQIYRGKYSDLDSLINVDNL
jgi:hypothetical protein